MPKWDFMNILSQIFKDFVKCSKKFFNTLKKIFKKFITLQNSIFLRET